MSAGLEIPEKLNVADYFLDRHLRAGNGARVAVAGVASRLTYGELAVQANRTGNALRQLGVRPGGRVLLVLPDSPEFIACFFGAARIGAVAVPVNPFARAADYAYYAADCHPQVAVVHSASLGQALPVLRQIETGLRIVTVGQQVSGCDSLESLLAMAGDTCEAHPTAADDIAFFLYTSGSGGQPKAAMHRHRHMLVTARSFAREVLAIQPDDVTFSASKLFFAYGLGNGMYFPLSVGAATVLLPEKPTPEKLFEVLEQHRPTLFFAVPTLYGALLHAAQGARRQLDFLRLAISAGERLPPEIFERFHVRFGIEILDGIGTTEMLHMFISSRPGAAVPGSCGQLVSGYHARVVDDAGGDLPPGEIGNLWVQGGSAFGGYWDKPELSERARRGHWVVTGDKFYRDADGFFHYCGRADDMLKISGMWVSPMEVENALLAHEAVVEAAVVGQRDPDGLTQIVAYVVPRSGREGVHPLPLAAAGKSPAVPSSSVTPSAVEGPAFPAQDQLSPAAPAAGDQSDLADALLTFARARLPGYKCPQRFEFVPELPKTATGKIQRYKLRS